MLPFTIKKYGKFHVIRDDLIAGGTKRRVLEELLPSIENDMLVYPGHAFGYAGFALGIAAQKYNKNVHLFFSSDSKSTEVFKRTISLKNVSYSIISTISRQADLVDIALDYAKKKNAYLFPVGFKIKEFSNILCKQISTINIQPKEIRCLGGSGTLDQCLINTRPNTNVMVVDLGMGHSNIAGHKIYKAPQKPQEKASILPPYPASIFYDAKIRQFISMYGNDGAFIRNVA